MKKIVMLALGAMCSAAAFAAGETYQVYKISMKVETTDAKGITSTCACDDYCYRERRKVVINGILAGCGCEAINGNGVCKNAILYLWDATRGIAITNVEMITPWTVQKVGKNLAGIEHFASFRCSYGEEDRYSFEITMAGLGKFKESPKAETYYSYVSGIDGKFAGFASAPIYVEKGVSSVCYATEDLMLPTTAYEVCEKCSDSGLTVAQYGEQTPFFGTYAVRYDATKSKRISSNGPSVKGFGLPSYVGLDDYVATNIGD